MLTPSGTPGARGLSTRLVFLDCNLQREPERRERRHMTWVKPEFEVIDLCSEVTSYLYTR